MLKADTGATQHYVKATDVHLLLNPTPTDAGPQVRLPDGKCIKATHSGHLPLRAYNLAPTATRAHVFPHLRNASLLSLGQLCDDGCIAVFDKDKLEVFKDGTIVITGTRNQTDGLWDVNLNPPPPDPTPHPIPSANAIIRKDKGKHDQATYIHATMGSPPITSLLQAIRNGNLIGWPGVDNVTESHLIKSIATAKGHLEQSRANLQSTKPVPTPEDEATPLQEEKTNECYALISNIPPKATGYMDLTGRFSRQSSRGHQYVMLVYDRDSNGILVEPLKNRQAAEITRAWKVLHK